jgi:hypothetical protein
MLYTQVESIAVYHCVNVPFTLWHDSKMLAHFCQCEG